MNIIMFTPISVLLLLMKFYVQSYGKDLILELLS